MKKLWLQFKNAVAKLIKRFTSEVYESLEVLGDKTEGQSQVVLKTKRPMRTRKEYQVTLKTGSITFKNTQINDNKTWVRVVLSPFFFTKHFMIASFSAVYKTYMFVSYGFWTNTKEVVAVKDVAANADVLGKLTKKCI